MLEIQSLWIALGQCDFCFWSIWVIIVTIHNYLLHLSAFEFLEERTVYTISAQLCWHSLTVLQGTQMSHVPRWNLLQIMFTNRAGNNALNLKNINIYRKIFF